MGNCLVTKLKAVVDNDNLEYLNGAVLEVGGFNNNEAVTLKSNMIITVDKVKTNMQGVTISTSNDGRNLDISGLSGKSGKVIIKDISAWPVFMFVQGNNLMWKTQYFHLDTGQFLAKVKANVAAADTSTKFMSTPIWTGKITDFGNFIAMTTLNLYSSGYPESLIDGNIRDLADLQVAAGRTSGSLDILCNGHVTDGSTVVEKGTHKIITFNANGYTIS